MQLGKKSVRINKNSIFIVLGDFMITTKRQTTETTCSGTAKSGCGCIVEGTLVFTEEGLRPIETIRIGDRVFSPERGMYADVINTWTGIEFSDITEISAGSVKVKVTGDHPIFTRAGYVSAKLLKAGELVWSKDGIPCSVTKVTVSNSEVKVYNLDTVNDVGYAVGGYEGLWVGTNCKQNEILKKGGREYKQLD
ncbi:MAG: HINT domain-containing protein [Oscillospiraceae bacterium]|nr:HINT domain-containing protein [Oscillospiraceae bacterium]